MTKPHTRDLSNESLWGCIGVSSRHLNYELAYSIEEFPFSSKQVELFQKLVGEGVA